MPGRIFISYRRSESAKDARALYERLSRDFGHGRIFIDLEGIDPGEDFVASLEKQLDGCEVFLALIGRDWLMSCDSRGQRRLDDPSDFVRIELRTALTRAIRVIPVLVDGATMPAATDLPQDVRNLARRQAISLDFGRFDADAGRLAASIRKTLDSANAQVAAGADAPSTTKPAVRQRRRLTRALAVAICCVVLLVTGWLALRTSQERSAPRVSAPHAASSSPVDAPRIDVTPPSTGPSPTQSAERVPAGVSKRWRDCQDVACPWLVSLAPGRFMMGELQGQVGIRGDEIPRHEVQIAYPLAIMEAEVTRGQFRAFIEATNYTTENCDREPYGSRKPSRGLDWRDPGFAQTDDHPVVCVNWYDAQEYAKWLSTKTGQRYRLPSESEWEYAARAGSTSRFGFGDSLESICAVANVFDQAAASAFGNDSTGRTGLTKESADCTDGHVYTAISRTFKSNAWGLYDMYGNASEWVQDCIVDFNYKRTPVDGSSVDGSACVDANYWVSRGGSWETSPFFARAARRGYMARSYRTPDQGMRLVRVPP